MLPYDRPTPSERREWEAEKKRDAEERRAKRAQITVSYYGDPLPVVYGTDRVPGQQVFFRNRGAAEIFEAGKDELGFWGVWKLMKGEAASVAMAICEAPVSGVGTVWKELTDSYAQSDWNRLVANGSNIEFVTGSAPSAWPILSGTSLAGSAMQGTCYMRAQFLALKDGKIPDMDFEIRGRCINTASGDWLDANPADVIVDMLTDPRIGVGLSASQVVVDAGIDGKPESSYRNWCTSMGFMVSKAIKSDSKVADELESLLDDTFATAVWSNGVLKIVPKGPSQTGSYYPPTGSVRIDDDELIYDEGEDPITVERVPDTEVFNTIPVSLKVRERGYEEVSYVQSDAAHSSKYGIKRDSTIKTEWLRDPLQAMKLSHLLAQESINIRNKFTFTVGPRWTQLEPMDIISLSESTFGLVDVPVRIQSIEDKEDGTREIEAVEYPLGQVMVTLDTPTVGDGYAVTPAWTQYPLYKATDASSSFGTISGSIDGKANKDMSNVPTGSVGRSTTTLSNLDNLFPNPTSEMAPPPGANLNDAEWAYRTNAMAFNGVWSRWLNATGSEIQLGPIIACHPGETFYLEAMGMRFTANGGNSGGVYFASLNTNKVAIHGGVNQVGLYPPSANDGQYVWAKFQGEYTTVDGAAYVRPYVYAQPGTNYLFDAFYCRRSIDTRATTGQLSEATARAITAIGKVSSSLFFRGNDVGIPNINKLSVYPRVSAKLTTPATLSLVTHEFQFSPSAFEAPDDSLDSLTHLWLTYYKSDGTEIGQFNCPINGRAYRTDGSGNGAYATYAAPLFGDYVNGASPYTFTGYLKVVACNQYGISAARTFAPNNNTSVALVDGVWGGGSPYIPPDPPAEEYPPDENYCVDPDTMIWMGTKAPLRAGDLVVGDRIWTRAEDGSGWGMFPVSATSTSDESRLKVSLTDGRHITVSEAHRFFVDGDWVETRNLTPGQIITGAMPGTISAIEPVGVGTVVRLTIDGAHTYISEGLLSHNMKKQL